MVNSDFTKGLKANRDPIRIISRIYKVNTVADREIQQVNCTQCFERFPCRSFIVCARWLGAEGGGEGERWEGRTVNSYYQRHLTEKIPRFQWLVDGQNLRPRRTGISFWPGLILIWTKDDSFNLLDEWSEILGEKKIIVLFFFFFPVHDA